MRRKELMLSMFTRTVALYFMQYSSCLGCADVHLRTIFAVYYILEFAGPW